MSLTSRRTLRQGRSAGAALRCPVAPASPTAPGIAPDAARRAACADDLLAFARTYLAHRMTAPSAPFHQELLDLFRETLQTPGAGAVIAAPRGHSKSTLLSFVAPLHALLYSRKRVVVLISNTAFLSTSLVRAIKQELESNALLRADFGDLVGGKWTDSDVELANGAKLVGRSMGAQIRGIAHLGQRPDLIVADDLENDEHVQTPEQRAKAYAWWTEAVLPALDPQRGNVIVVGTVLHFDSLLSKLLAQTGDYRTRTYATSEEAPLWPEWMGSERLAAARRQVGDLAFAREYQNRPFSEAMQLFRPAWWRWWVRDDLRRGLTGGWEYQGQPLTIYQGVDPASSLKVGADYFGHVTVGVTPQGECLVLQATQQRLSFDAQVAYVEEQAQVWGPQLIGCEAVAYQEVLVQALAKSPCIAKRVRGVRPRRLPGVAGKVAGEHVAASGKEARLLSRTGLVEQGRVLLRAAGVGEPSEAVPDLAGVRVHPEMLAFYTQATQFPASAHDDLLDAWDIALEMAAERGSGAVWGVLVSHTLEGAGDLAQAHADWTRLTGGYSPTRYGIR
ncbi:MAG TPA: hypothetical protein VK066_12300 [Chloroflexota bacterium]|nr:hypothetical protein [Chloroflexota bacterium]